MARHRRLCIRGRESKGGGHAFAALTVGSRRVVNNRDVICKIIHPTEVCGFNDAEIPELARFVSRGTPVSMWANASALVESRPLCGRRGPHRRHRCARWKHAWRSDEGRREQSWTSSRIGRVAAVACSAWLPVQVLIGAGALTRAPADALTAPEEGTEWWAEMAGYGKWDRAS